MVRDLQRNHPTAARDVMRTTRVRSKVERSRACAPLTKTQVWDSGFFAHALFVPKTPNVIGFSGSVNGTTKNPGFLDFGFCQCNWALCPYIWPNKNHVRLDNEPLLSIWHQNSIFFRGHRVESWSRRAFPVINYEISIARDCHHYYCDGVPSFVATIPN